MSKASSYYDWELKFRKKPEKNFKSQNGKDHINSLGILDSEFKDFVKNWKEQNPF